MEISLYGPHTRYHQNGETYSSNISRIFARFGRILIFPANFFLSLTLTTLATHPTGHDLAHSLSPRSPLRIFLFILLILPTLLSILLSLPGLIILGLSNLTRHHFTFVLPTEPFNHTNDLPNPILSRGLRILTFNIGTLPQFISVFNLMRPLHVRVGEIISSINQSDYDVICLQELFDEEMISRVLAEIDRTKYSYIVAGPGRTRKLLYNSGLCIISRYPISTPTFWGYDERSGDDSFAHKGVLAVRIELSATQEICVFNTHLQAGGPNSEKIRQKQLASISHVYENYIVDREDKHIIASFACGDYNIGKYRSNRDAEGNLVIDDEWPTSEWYFSKQHYLYAIEAADLTNTEHGHGTVWDMRTPHTGWSLDRVQDWTRKEAWIDHIMVVNRGKALRGRLDVIDAGISLSSDHLAVSGTFQLSDEPIVPDLHDPINL